MIGDQVHVPQVRSLRNSGEKGRTLRPGSQHHQREDLHHPLVLVRAAGRPDRPLHRLHRGHREHARAQEEPDHQEGQQDQQRRCLSPGGESSHRRLVHVLLDLQEYGHHDVQYFH